MILAENAGRDGAGIGIDFVEVAETHVLFFSRMKDFVHGELPESNDDLLEFGQRCELDVWLKGGAATRFGQLKAFNRLLESHDEFHRYATEVLARIHAGSWIVAENVRKSELSQSLRRLLLAITELNDVLGSCMHYQPNEPANCTA